MKKTRVPASIDAENHQRIKYLIKTHPELNYKKISRFVNESLAEKLDKIEDELILKKIKNSGIDSFVQDTKMEERENSKKIEAIEKRLDYFENEYEAEEDIKDPNSILARMYKEIPTVNKKLRDEMNAEIHKNMQKGLKKIMETKGFTKQIADEIFKGKGKKSYSKRTDENEKEKNKG